MNNHQTKLMQQNGRLPTLLEFKRLAHLRGLLTPKEAADFLREEKGAEGENLVHAFLYEEGAPDWVNIRNIWLYDGSVFECDSVLFTGHKMHTFEVKHYTGRFTYQNGSCKIGQIKMEKDCIQQARKSFLKLRKLCRNFSPNIEVHGGIIFSSNKNKVVIESPVEDIQVFEMPDLYGTFNEFCRKNGRIPIHRLIGSRSFSISNHLNVPILFTLRRCRTSR